MRPNYTANVVDGPDHPSPSGVQGLPVVGGTGVGLGYINDAALTTHNLGIYLPVAGGMFVLLGRIAGDKICG